MKVRLNKFLATSGVASRRWCDEAILEGEVTVNGYRVMLPQTLVDPSVDKICFRRKQVRQEDLVYFLLHKPFNYVCSAARLFTGTKLVTDIFKHLPYRLFNVGRLDKETTGLILMTNDGLFANKAIHPSYNITKEYLLKVRQDITDTHLKKLTAGTFVEGVFVKPVSVKKVRKGTLKITVKEGKKHEIRILAAHASLDLLELVRIRIGSLVLGSLKPGEYRPLTPCEIEEILLKEKRTDKLRKRPIETDT
ncbi:putative RNA pseudouridine synthase [Candidatus Clavichlamydia salmonicola]|uniref:pseudouridine synthase n=1 Tax=Candidatus Clavichlamydia salmonicola TaxID=469812 RepID=UPI001891497C|nr:pseudouridine synthase [Candidatus Clavichlamydia salmonicola]MBF5050534.1 putative RNA pseudouridine synthase [Candidatus Clavichlamydia salmonicola]